ncbi:GLYCEROPHOSPHORYL DIESTER PHOSPHODIESTERASE [Salix koriyanagi]|uniref:glycerophosphodiester phosphodiesterase n=1 Tax=Salix koriyanagi TaxID=2511006 RepID=A0A9Q0X173_9ROSI|nr:GLYCEROPHOSPHORYL DIESTER PHOSPHODIESTERASE [Salix koriyanagi]
MALKAVHVSDVPNLDHVPENASLSLYSTRFSKGAELNREAASKTPKFLVIGHRGNGMNILQSTDRRMKAIKENSIMSFNSAAKHPIDFIEFDVQVWLSTSFFSLFRFTKGKKILFLCLLGIRFFFWAVFFLFLENNGI